MKRVILIWMAVFMVGSMAMAQQQENRRGKMPDPKVRAERMTERMAKEYALDDGQKKQLLEANLAFVEKMGDRPMGRRSHIKRGGRDCESCVCNRTSKRHAKHEKEERKARRKEMKEAHAAYDKQLQGIMTKEQYDAYNKKKQERKAKAEAKRKVA